jgi:hypothetical protein
VRKRLRLANVPETTGLWQLSENRVSEAAFLQEGGLFERRLMLCVAAVGFRLTSHPTARRPWL